MFILCMLECYLDTNKSRKSSSWCTYPKSTSSLFWVAGASSYSNRFVAPNIPFNIEMFWPESIKSSVSLDSYNYKEKIVSVFWYGNNTKVSRLQLSFIYIIFIKSHPIWAYTIIDTIVAALRFLSLLSDNPFLYVEQLQRYFPVP